LLCADYGLSPDRVDVIPNWASKSDTAVVGADAIDDWRRSLELGDRFLVLYAGNFGLAQDADLLIQCLAACSHMTDVLFCFAGGGGQYERLRSEETKGSTPNIRVVPFQTGTRYSSLLKLADCGLVSLHPHLRGMAVPSKVAAYMAAGLPIICLAEQGSDLANMVEETASGIACQSPRQFAEAVRLILSDGVLRGRMVEGALRAAETRYSRSRCISLFVRVLSRLPS
jgi:colanic acid biosynthesis glycosyl transferase WcaI